MYELSPFKSCIGALYEYYTSAHILSMIYDATHEHHFFILNSEAHWRVSVNATTMHH